MADSKKTGQAWIVSASMGYGHQRAAYPLSGLAPNGKVINANDYPGMPERDKRIWESSNGLYDFISRFHGFPLIGKIIFGLFDRFQKIQKFYPKRDLSKPTLQLKQTFSAIKRGWGKDLIEKLSKRPLPFISTFFISTFMAEFYGYKGEIYCLVTDTDASRVWVSPKPSKSKIKYLAPTQRVAERLKAYGVKPGNIFLTGFPLPAENVGGAKMAVLKKDLRARIFNLDPDKNYTEKYSPIIGKYLGGTPIAARRPLSLMFAVGGAGAQKEIGIQAVESLAARVGAGEVRVVLVAGTRQEVRDYFFEGLGRLGLERRVEIIFEKEINAYFRKFNEVLRRTDILWTKPSELSFYSALGLPILIAPPVGSQEKFNKSWLIDSGFGIAQDNPAYADQWLFDWLKRGYFAECAMEGFVEGEQSGALNIEKIIFKT